MSTEKASLTLDYALRRQLQHERLAGLLTELEREHGPIDPQVIEEVRRAWPAPEENACHELPLVELSHRGTQPD